MSAPHRTPTRRHVRRSAALVAAIALGATACGVQQGSDVSAGGRAAGGESPATTSTIVLDEGSFEGTGGAVFLRNAAEATSEVTTSKIAMTMTMAGMPMVGDVVISYDGAFDNEAGQARMTVDMGDLLSMLGEGAGQMEMVVDGTSVYLRSEMFATVSGGKPWIRVDEAELDAGGSELGVGVQGDPTAFLDFLEGVGDEVETVRREDLRGVPTTHVRTNIDMAKLIEEASPEDRAEYEKSLEGLGGAAELFRSIPVEAWVDDNGYVRRFTMTFDVSGVDEAAEVGADLAITIDVEMYDFNEPVDIEVPDPADVEVVSGLDLGG